MTIKELEKLRKAIEKYKAEISFSADKLIAEVDSIGMSNVEFEPSKKEEEKPPW